MELISAYRQDNGIQINEVLSDGSISCRFIGPEDEGWLQAVSLLLPEDSFEPPIEYPTELEPVVVDLDQYRNRSIFIVNTVIGEIRKRYITDIPGQDGIYASKMNEAVDYLAGVMPEDLTEYPFLAAEVGITAPDAYQLSQLWLNMGEQWTYLGAALEGLRTGAIAGVKMAEDAATIEGIMSAFTAQAGAI